MQSTQQNLFIGIDPGLAHCGWGVVCFRMSKVHLLACGEIQTSSTESLAMRLQHIYQELYEVFSRYQPGNCAVEELYFNKNRSSGLPVAHARGVALLCAAQQGALVREFSANRIKQAVTGYGKAEKWQVQQMLTLLLATEQKAPLPASDHAADALAAAICMIHQQEGEGGLQSLDAASAPSRSSFDILLEQALEKK